MDIDFQIESDLVVLLGKDERKEKQKKQKRILLAAEDSLRTLVVEKISGRMGDC